MKKTLTELYESILVCEVAGAKNYWIAPTGELEQVYNHIEYAMHNIDDLDVPYYEEDGYLYDENGSIGDEDVVYEAAYKLGYIRVVEQPSAIYFTYSRTRHPDRTQFMVLYGMAQDKNKNLVDGETQKVIIKNNEVKPDVARNDKLQQMDQEIQPSFYKKRGNYGESFSKFDLSDYTELIYEGKSGHGDEKAVTNLLKDYIGKGLITVKDTKCGWLVKSTDGKSQEAIHKGERAFHYLRRFLQKLGEGVLHDNTSILNEYNITKHDIYDDDEFGSYRMGTVKPKPLPDKPDYRQNMIDDAIEEIQAAKKHNMKDSPVYSLESKIEFWTNFLHEHEFTRNEIEDIISMGLEDWKDFRK